MIKSLKDLKIMSNIIENARIPISELAKKTRLSREIVQYRLKNLEKNLIAGYQARINLKLFSDSIYTIYLNVQGLEREEIISKLKKLPFVHWIGSTLGRWNYIITFSVNKSNSLNNFLNKLFNMFENKQIKYILTQQIIEYKDTFSGLFGKNQLIVSQKDSERIKIDSIDKKILEQLTKNARTSNEEIAEKVNLTREAVRKRIKRLEKSQVILNYRTLIKPQALELTSYVLAIKCKTYDTKDLEKLCSFFANYKSFSYVCNTAGDFNVLGVLTTNSFKELDNICTKIRLDFSNMIEEIEPLPLVEVGSQEYLPKT